MLIGIMVEEQKNVIMNRNNNIHKFDMLIAIQLQPF